MSFISDSSLDMSTLLVLIDDLASRREPASALYAPSPGLGSFLRLLPAVEPSAVALCFRLTLTSVDCVT